MKKFTLLIFILGMFSTVLRGADDVPPRDILANYDFMVGHWHLINRSLQPDFTILEQPFYVKIKYDSDGLALKNIWFEYAQKNQDEPYGQHHWKANKRKRKKYFGTVFQTYDPAQGAMVTNYFNAKKSAWTISSKVTTFSEGLIESKGFAEDGFGPYEYHLKTEKLSENKHQFISQRLYESLGFWITVDSYVATRIDHEHND